MNSDDILQLNGYVQRKMMLIPWQIQCEIGKLRYLLLPILLIFFKSYMFYFYFPKYDNNPMQAMAGKDWKDSTTSEMFMRLFR